VGGGRGGAAAENKGDAGSGGVVHRFGARASQSSSIKDLAQQKSRNRGTSPSHRLQRQDGVEKVFPGNVRRERGPMVWKRLPERQSPETGTSRSKKKEGMGTRS